MAQFSISIDIAHLVQAGTALTKGAFPHLAAAVQAITDRVEARWKAYAAGAPLPDGKVVHSRSGAYTRSIMQRSTGDFSAVVYSELPYAQKIEEGTPRHDLKSLLNSSPKVRVSRAGRRYLIIAFRHSPNPNNVMRDNPMPQAVTDWWQGKVASSISGTHTRLSGTGAFDIHTRQRLTVPAWSYKWGDRLGKSALQSLGASDQQTRRMQGMVNFRQPGKSGGAAHSQYITFRTMTENSKGWIVPQQPGKWPARQTAAIFTPVAEQLFAAAVAEDVRAVLPGAETT